MPTTPTPRTVSGNVWAAMRGQRPPIRQAALAHRMGRSQGWVSARMTGRTPWRFDDILRVALALNVPVADLIDGTDTETAA